MCILQSYHVNDRKAVSDICSDYDLGYIYANYTEHTHCIGNWPGLIMTKMPYWESKAPSAPGILMNVHTKMTIKI